MLRWPEPEIDEPDMVDYLARTVTDGDWSEATDGCIPVEPDGRCEHGHPSWELFWGII